MAQPARCCCCPQAQAALPKPPAAAGREEGQPQHFCPTQTAAAGGRAASTSTHSSHSRRSCRASCCSWQWQALHTVSKQLCRLTGSAPRKATAPAAPEQRPRPASVSRGGALLELGDAQVCGLCNKAHLRQSPCSSLLQSVIHHKSQPTKTQAVSELALLRANSQIIFCSQNSACCVRRAYTTFHPSVSFSVRVTLAPGLQAHLHCFLAAVNSIVWLCTGRGRVPARGDQHTPSAASSDSDTMALKQVYTAAMANMKWLVVPLLGVLAVSFVGERPRGAAPLCAVLGAQRQPAPG